MERLENLSWRNYYEIQPLSDLGVDVRKFLRNANEFERKAEYESHELMNLEIGILSLLKSFKINRLKSSPEVKPKKKIVKWTYINAKERKKRKLKCPHCEKTFESVSLKSLQYHVRTDHKGCSKVTAKDIGEEEDLVECLLPKPNGNKCGKKGPRDNICRHLGAKKAHKKIPDRPESSSWWGFKKSSEGDVEVVWLLPGEQAPPAEEEIEVDIQSDSVKDAFVAALAVMNESDHNQDDSSRGNTTDVGDNNPPGQKINPDVGAPSDSLDTLQLIVQETVGALSPKALDSNTEIIAAEAVGDLQVPKDKNEDEVKTLEIQEVAFNVEERSMFEEENSGSGDTVVAGHQIQQNDVHPDSLYELMSFVTDDTQLQPQQSLEFETEDHSVMVTLIPSSLNKPVSEVNVFPQAEMMNPPFKDQNIDNVLDSNSIQVLKENSDTIVWVVPENEDEEGTERKTILVSDRMLSSTADDSLPEEQIFLEDHTEEVIIDESIDALGSIEPLNGCDEDRNSENSLFENLSPPMDFSSLKDKVFDDHLPVKVKVSNTEVDEIVDPEKPNPVTEKKIRGERKPIRSPRKKTQPSKQPTKRLNPSKKKQSEPALLVAETFDSKKRKIAGRKNQTPSIKKPAKRSNPVKRKQPEPEPEPAQFKAETVGPNFYGDENDEDTNLNICAERKKLRYMNRKDAEPSMKNSETPENAAFISDFDSYLRSKTKDSTRNKDPSTFSLTHGHLWDWPDCYLHKWAVLNLLGSWSMTY